MTEPGTEPGAEATVRWDAGLKAHLVSGFEEAQLVLRGPGWSSDPANSPAPPPGGPGGPDLPPALMLFRDPPDHTRLRRLVAPAFAARAVEDLRPRVAAIVESCLRGLGDDEIDLLADYAYLVPIAVIAELLDVGVEGAQVFLEQTPHLARMLEVDAGEDELEAAVGAALELTLFLAPVLSTRRGAGRGEDFISQLLATELTLDEVLGTCVLLLAAGHETTANLIGTGTLALTEHPEQVPVLLAEPVRAVEELLRLHGPVKLVARTATADHDLGGHRVAAGEAVLVMLQAANRDPRRWEEPDRLDLARLGPPNLAFGGGIHYCLGAALARLEAAEALVRLFRVHPGLRPAPGRAPSWRTSSTFHALDALPVVPGPAGATAMRGSKKPT